MVLAAQRTMSSRRAAGSRLNKKYKFVGTKQRDTLGGAPFDSNMSPNHPARQLNVASTRPAMQGLVKVEMNLINRLNGMFRWRGGRA